MTHKHKRNTSHQGRHGQSLPPPAKSEGRTPANKAGQHGATESAKHATSAAHDDRESREDHRPERIYTVSDLSRRFKVSTKTVERWRNRGLASQFFKAGNRRRVGFLKSAVDQFVAEHRAEIERGTRFSQLSPDERTRVIQAARRLARQGHSAAEIARELSEQFERSSRTIRYVLKKHDQEHPEARIFKTAVTPILPAAKTEIFEKYQQGLSVEQLAEEYGRSKASIYRIVNEHRIRRLLDQPIEFVYHESFEDPAAGREILGPPPEAKKGPTVRAPAGLPPYLASLYETPLLTRQQEAHYFRKMNYLKFCAARLRDQLDMARVRSKDLDRIEQLLTEAAATKELLVRSNLRLVVSVARRYLKAGADFFEMISDGNISLMRAIDRFDYSKGYKLSTYATWAIMNNFSRSLATEHSRADRFRTGIDEMFHSAADRRGDQFRQELNNQQQRTIVADMLTGLSDREREIIQLRYGLRTGSETETLEQIGQRLGVTKERVRQLEMRALEKLRAIAAETPVDIPGI